MLEMSYGDGEFSIEVARNIGRKEVTVNIQIDVATGFSYQTKVKCGSQVAELTRNRNACVSWGDAVFSKPIARLSNEELKQLLALQDIVVLTNKHGDVVGLVKKVGD